MIEPRHWTASTEISHKVPSTASPQAIHDRESIQAGRIRPTQVWTQMHEHPRSGHSRPVHFRVKEVVTRHPLYYVHSHFPRIEYELQGRNANLSIHFSRTQAKKSISEKLQQSLMADLSRWSRQLDLSWTRRLIWQWECQLAPLSNKALTTAISGQGPFSFWVTIWMVAGPKEILRS